MFFAPNLLGDPNNYIPANPLQTPPDIVPEWYFLPFYAILRSIPNKLAGVCLMFGSILVLFVLPWLDTSPVRSARFRPIYPRAVSGCWWSTVFVLGVCGAHQPEGIWVVISAASARCYYFLHFLVILPVLGKLERPLPLPDEHQPSAVLAHGAEGRYPGRRRRSRWRKPDARGRLDLRRLLPALAARWPRSPGASRRRSRRKLRRRRSQDWSWQGPFGTFDRAAAQRGFQVYNEVCSTCHSMNVLHYRDLAGIGLQRRRRSRRSPRRCRCRTGRRPGQPKDSARARRPSMFRRALRQRASGAGGA